MTRHLFGGAAALSMACLTAGSPAWAHHSFAMFELNKAVVLTGVVTEFQWTNPHTWIELDVKDESGKVTHWSIETGSLVVLARQGWKSTTLKPGDKVTIKAHPLRSGEPGGSFDGVILPDGRTLGKPFTVSKAD